VPPAPTERLRLADGRSLDLWYDDTPGAEALTPFIFHPGTPGSGLPFDDFAQAIRARGLRGVSWSRPGYGSSTRRAGRIVADVVEDAVAVLDHLGADRAYVGGHSGGGPHAIACAALLPDRVLATAVIAGVAPWKSDGLDFLDGMGVENHEEFGAALDGEAALATYLEPQRQVVLTMTGEEVAAMFGDLVDEVDRASLTGEHAAFVATLMAEGLRESSAGWIDDDIAFTRPWGFDLGSIGGRVHVWQGGHDRMVPFAHGQWLAAHLGNPCVHLHPEHGHMTLAVGAFPQILDSLIDGT
jgi:pimeloyl-ACP methyl ester carboxylesterase